MADGLPEGLVTHRPSITGEIGRVDRVESEDIAQLWKGIWPRGSSNALPSHRLCELVPSLFHQQGRDRRWGGSTAGEFLLEDLEQQENPAWDQWEASSGAV